MSWPSCALSVGILERGKLVFAGSVQSALDAARSGTRLECELDGGMDTALSLLGPLWGGVRSVAVDEGARRIAWWFIWKPNHVGCCRHQRTSGHRWGSGSRTLRREN